MSQRDPVLFMVDMVTFAREIGEWMKDVPPGELATDRKTKGAVLHSLMLIGEAAARMPADLRQVMDEVEWKKVVGFRNVAIHGYWDLLGELAEETARTHVPVLERVLVRHLREHHPLVAQELDRRNGL